MTTWNPGGGGPDLLSLGDEGTPRPFTVRTVTGAALCLALGIVLGVRLTGEMVAAREATSPTVDLVGGSVSEVTGVEFDGSPPQAPVPAAVRGPASEPGAWGPARTKDITGAWLIEGVHGVWKGLEGRQLMHFETDDGFAWNFAGRLAGPYRAVRGRYTLVDGLLTVTVEKMNLCHADDTYTWQTTMIGAHRMHMARMPGTGRLCGSPSTDALIVRRVPPAQHLPDARPLKPLRR